MRRPTASSPKLRVLIWLSSVLVLGGAGLALVGATSREFMDCSNPDLHESANTTFGWTVAIVASLVPVAIGVWLAGGPWRRLPALAFTVAALSLVIWWWMLDADCEWYSLAPV